MEHNSIKIEDVLTSEYADFLEFCSVSGKIFVSELTSVDYIAFRTSYGQPKDRINTIKKLLQEGVPVAEKKASLEETRTVIEAVSEDVSVSDSLTVEKVAQVAEDYDSPSVDDTSDTVQAVDDTDAVETAAKTYGDSDEQSLYERFRVDPANFEDIKIDALELSVRSMNCLQRSASKSIADLLRLRVSDLKQIRNMGAKSVDEVIAVLGKYTQDYTPVPEEPKQHVTELSEELKRCIEAFLLDESYCVGCKVCEVECPVGAIKFDEDGNVSNEGCIRDLDELKHSNNVHPESLIKQFGHLDSIKDRALGLLNGNISKVIIAADHGTSRLAVKIRNTEYDNALPKPEGVSVYKYGRFCDDAVDETLYPTAISINDRLIFADYSRFVQPGAPIDEIHGGASLEEWIVPVIVVEKLGKKKKVTKVVITPKATKYKPELVTKLVRVQFTISGEKRDKVYATVRGQKILCEYQDGCYNFVFTAESSDNKLLIKVADGGIIGQFEIEIEQGIKKNLKFDI